PFLTTEQIQEMSSAGYTMGAHTRNHCSMIGMTDEAIEKEIVRSCSIIHEITGKEVPFAFPYNGRGIDRGLLARIREKHDFVGLYFDTAEMVHDEPHIVNRIGADAPSQAIPNGTNLPGVVRRTWSRRSSWN
ncbi:MAG: polysaccharide deacetylase family protein, partial [Planctomycetaceae bacterium]|nr:polysaccharide deacetylase family protein [Planctomycetaceae bacterium]